jgi:dihydropteroate synthase
MVNQLANWRARIAQTDKKLSARHIHLDPAGYFLIYIDREQGLICADHYAIVVDERGLAVDPDTGKPLSAKGPTKNELITRYKAPSAKALSVEIFEQAQSPVTHFNHAAYLGREFQRAEFALVTGEEYVQD